MKRFRNIALSLFLFALVPTASFAMFDAAVYGSYDMGYIDTDTWGEELLLGWNAGAIGHFHPLPIPMLNLGIGGFVQRSYLKGTYTGFDRREFSRTTVGADVIAQLALIKVFMPYVHAGVGILDAYSSDFEYLDFDNQNFKSWLAGAGVSINVTGGALPLYLMGEFTYNYADMGEADMEVYDFKMGLQVIM